MQTSPNYFGVWCSYTWTCAVFLTQAHSCFIDESLDDVILPHSTELPTVIRPVTLSGRQLHSDAKDFLFTLTVWKDGRGRSSTTQLLSTSSHSAGDEQITDAQLE